MVGVEEGSNSEIRKFTETKMEIHGIEKTNVSTRAARLCWGAQSLGEIDCHLRRRDHQVDVQVNEPETGLLPTNV